MLIKLLVQSFVIIFFSLFAAVSTAVAESDYSARPSLSAAEHFAAAKAIADLTQDYEDGAEFPTEAAVQAVWHVDQAIAKGYPDHKQADRLLNKMLSVVITSNYDCFMGKYKDSKDPAILKLCAPMIAAKKRKADTISERYRNYPTDPGIVLSYASYMSLNGASKAEIEALYKKTLQLSKSPEISGVLAYLLVEEEKYDEAKERFAETLELVSDEYLLADNLERFVSHLRGFGCAMPAETEQAVKAIPMRYKSESGAHEHEQKIKEKIKPTKEELEDSKKLAAIKKQVIDAIRKAQCKAPG
jgi:hypothetical protein